MHISLPLIATVIAGVQLVTGTPAGIPTTLEPRADNGACAKAASAVASAVRSSTKARVTITAQLAYDCLKSVPFKKDPARELVKSMKAYAQFESNIDYLRAPPSGYLYDKVDIPKLLDALETKVISANSYDNEYDFQVDLQSILIRSRDGHFSFSGELVDQFFWKRPNDYSLISVSKDGKELPQIYRAQDLLDIDLTNGNVNLLKNPNASPIKTINGLDASKFVEADAFSICVQDPDNAYNTRMFRPQDFFSDGTLGSFNAPVFYPGPTTSLEFQNGTKATFNNLVSVIIDTFTGVSTGEDMYKKFCSDEDTSSSNTKRDLELHQFKKRDSATVLPRQSNEESFYPLPSFSDASGVLTGYLFEKVAVLAVYSFSPGNGTKAALESFQRTAEKFFAAAVQKGIKNLVIDLQGNGGGAIDLSIDLYAQLFPDKAPNSKDNMRTSVGMQGIMVAASQFAANADSLDAATNARYDRNVVPFAYQEVMTPDAKNFNRYQDLYGPKHIGNGFFTNFFQGNYTNDRPSQFGLPGIVITGTNSRKNFKQPFEAENIIMVTDGFCASACTIFQEHMKLQGVQVIAIGGRAQTGPMQAVGGTKGSQVFQSSNIQIMTDLFNNKDLNTELGRVKGTVFEDFNNLPVIRSGGQVGINGRNQFRIGDNTQTPLQFVYEAADCRIWYTADMAADITVLWDRVASLAFENRKNGVITSDFCVKDSTGHATSISGGLKTGEIGPQTPPANAKATVTGFLMNGKDIVSGSASGKITDDSPVDQSVSTSDGEGADSPDVIAAVETMVSVCKGYKGTEWFVQLMCGALQKQA